MSKKESIRPHLGRARRVKNDEFYTPPETVAAEMNSILETDSSIFEGASVYLPCDSEKSEFYKYFTDNFSALGLRELVATSYTKEGRGTLLKITAAGEEKSLLEGDGDFRSEEVQGYFETCDFIFTNPPFSLMREFYPKVAESGKSHSILSHIAAPGYLTVFNFFKSGEAQVSPSIRNSSPFKVPKNYDSKNVKFLPSGEKVEFIGTFFLTNIFRETPILELKRMEENDFEYRFYDNHPTLLEVGYVKNIPSDFFGPIAAPITALRFFPLEGFEILGLDEKHSWPEEELGPFVRPKIDGKRKFLRVIIKRKKA